MKKTLTIRTALVAALVGAALAFLIQRVGPIHDPVYIAKQGATAAIVLVPVLVLIGIMWIFFGWHRRFHTRMKRDGLFGAPRQQSAPE